MPLVRVRDLEVYYEPHGQGPRVLMISGTGGDLRQNPMRGELLVQRHEALIYDQRGLGQTSKPNMAYSMADYADDGAALMDTPARGPGRP